MDGSCVFFTLVSLHSLLSLCHIVSGAFCGYPEGWCAALQYFSNCQTLSVQIRPMW